MAATAISAIMVLLGWCAGRREPPGMITCSRVQPEVDGADRERSGVAEPYGRPRRRVLDDPAAEKAQRHRCQRFLFHIRLTNVNTRPEVLAHADLLV